MLLFGGVLYLEFVSSTHSADTFQHGVVGITYEAFHCRDITINIPVLFCQFTLHETDHEVRVEVIVDHGGREHIFLFLWDLCLLGITESSITEAP